VMSPVRGRRIAFCKQHPHMAATCFCMASVPPAGAVGVSHLFFLFCRTVMLRTGTLGVGTNDPKGASHAVDTGSVPRQ
jgi:hypothetical protein